LSPRFRGRPAKLGMSEQPLGTARGSKLGQSWLSVLCRLWTPQEKHTVPHLGYVLGGVPAVQVCGMIGWRCGATLEFHQQQSASF
jgi:hypothetical protein